MENLNRHYGVRFSRKTGKILETIVAEHGCALLKMAGLNTTKANQDFVVFDTTGEIKAYFEGKKGDMPTICRDMEGGDVNELCDGLLDALESEESEN